MIFNIIEIAYQICIIKNWIAFQTSESQKTFSTYDINIKIVRL